MHVRYFRWTSLPNSFWTIDVQKLELELGHSPTETIVGVKKIEFIKIDGIHLIGMSNEWNSPLKNSPY